MLSTANALERPGVEFKILVLLRKSWYENSLIMGGLRKSSQITLVVKFANLLSVKPMQVSLRLRLDRR